MGHRESWNILLQTSNFQQCIVSPDPSPVLYICHSGYYYLSVVGAPLPVYRTCEALAIRNQQNILFAFACRCGTAWLDIAIGTYNNVLYSCILINGFEEVEPVHIILRGAVSYDFPWKTLTTLIPFKIRKFFEALKKLPRSVFNASKNFGTFMLRLYVQYLTCPVRSKKIRFSSADPI